MNIHAKNRVIKELNDLDTKTAKLIQFIETDKFKTLPDSAKSLLESQREIMLQYLAILNSRLENWDECK